MMYAKCAVAAAHLVEGDYRFAAKAWREIIKMHPEQPGAYLSLGRTLHRSNRYIEATSLFLRSVELHDEGTEGWATGLALSLIHI